MGPILLKPVYISPIWAGTRIAEVRGLPADKDNNFGEAFDVSAHPTTMGVIENGKLAGMTLAEAIATHHDEIIGALPDQAVVQVTFMDPIANLSVQVHPDDEYAARVQGDWGKTESWYILKAKPGTTLIGGSTTNNLDELKAAAADDTIGDRFGRRVEVEEGDFLLIPAGTMHALGPGAFVVEVATFGNTTYRMCDWGRGRELHVKQAFDVVDTTSMPSLTRLGAFDPKSKTQSRVGVSCSQFVSNVVDIVDEWSCDITDRYQVLTCVDGAARISCPDADEIELGYTRSVLIPASAERVKVAGPCRILQSYRV